MSESMVNQGVQSPEQGNVRRMFGVALEALADLTGFGQLNWMRAETEGDLDILNEYDRRVLVDAFSATIPMSYMLPAFLNQEILDGKVIIAFLPVMALGMFQGFSRRIIQEVNSRRSATVSETEGAYE